MRVLALDTTTAVCRAALVADEQLVASLAGDSARPLAEQLPSRLLDLLSAANLTLNDVDVFAVAAGPGSFTGIRIGIATIQGLAFVTKRPVVAVSVLDAMGHIGGESEAEGTVVAACVDARRNEFFTALYRVAQGPPFTAAHLQMIAPPAVGSSAATLDRWRWDGLVPSVHVGDPLPGLDHHQTSPLRYKDAGSLAIALGRIAIHRARSGATSNPADVRPLYIRRPDAILAREKLSATG